MSRTRRRKNSDQVTETKEIKNRKAGVVKKTNRNTGKSTLRQIDFDNATEDNIDEEIYLDN
jgi:hypothetical protein|tara:strand:+ start:852 stop:1034 length:183 start_codon:yes stop_codon:yes gene_type:complete